jgi:hypothetical protein
MGIDFNDAEGIEPELDQQARSGETAMKNVPAVANPIISPESVKDDDGGGGGQKSFNQVMVSANKNMKVVKQVISQGGFTGPDKDKFDLIEAHNEWVKSRNENINCPGQIGKTSVRYTTLVNGKAGQNEIVKAHQTHINTKEICGNSRDRVLKTAGKYLEVDRRVRENRLKEQNTYQGFTTMDTTVEKFQTRSGGGSVVEGFNYYNVDNSYIDNSGGKYNQRLPRYTQSDTSRSDTDKSTLPWNQYFTVCDSGDKFCENAHILKDTYILSINSLFDKAEQKLNIYQNASLLKSRNMGETANRNTLNPMLDANNGAAVTTAIENQKKEIALYKQQALYNYDEYNTLSFIEDMFIFVYYAVFIMFVVFSLREFFSSTVGYDKRNIIILILLGIYPKYILNIVIWLLNGLTQITHMLGLKNVRFWY